MNPQFTIIYERGEDGYWIATIPEVPGAFSQGRTKEEARDNAVDALEELMTARRESAMRERTVTSETEVLSLAS